ncbi:MAG: rhodanese-like domain-containing protein, partial [Bradyrhizobium sp.]|nr:rhodanese-like domain-containing protein [Bradyrhizobium sp.]
MPERGGLLTTAELAGILDHPDLRLFDCTTYLEYLPEGSDVPYIAVPGRTTFEAGHIPGADFLDLQGEFSQAGIGLHFMMPGTAQLEAAFGRHGVGATSRVVLYSIGTPQWATRFWWMLKSLGFDNVAVLDGGFDAWKAEGRTIETGAAKGYPPAVFVAEPRAGHFVDKHATQKASKDQGTVVV